MSWVLLPTDFTDAVWSGLKKYTQVDNPDGTVSFQDVTQYSQKEKSFFGAYHANRMNEALNAIMAALEGGTDLYEVFQNFFSTQQQLFKAEADKKQDDMTIYIAGIESQGDALVLELKTNYRSEITQFEQQQEQTFNVWFRAIQDSLSQDAAGHLQNLCTELDERLSLLEYMTLQNDFSAPIATDDETVTLITDDYGNAILAEWKHKEV